MTTLPRLFNFATSIKLMHTNEIGHRAEVTSVRVLTSRSKTWCYSSTLHATACKLRTLVSKLTAAASSLISVELIAENPHVAAIQHIGQSRTHEYWFLVTLPTVTQNSQLLRWLWQWPSPALTALNVNMSLKSITRFCMVTSLALVGTIVLN